MDGEPVDNEWVWGVRAQQQSSAGIMQRFRQNPPNAGRPLVVYTDTRRTCIGRYPAFKHPRGDEAEYGSKLGIRLQIQDLSAVPQDQRRAVPGVGRCGGPNESVQQCRIHPIDPDLWIRRSELEGFVPPRGEQVSPQVLDARLPRGENAVYADAPRYMTNNGHLNLASGSRDRCVDVWPQIVIDLHELVTLLLLTHDFALRCRRSGDGRCRWPRKRRVVEEWPCRVHRWCKHVFTIHAVNEGKIGLSTPHVPDRGDTIRDEHDHKPCLNLSQLLRDSALFRWLGLTNWLVWNRRMYVHIGQSRHQVPSLAVHARNVRRHVHVGCRADPSDPPVSHADRAVGQHDLDVHRYDVHIDECEVPTAAVNRGVRWRIATCGYRRCQASDGPNTGDLQKLTSCKSSDHKQLK